MILGENALCQVWNVQLSASFSREQKTLRHALCDYDERIIFNGNYTDPNLMEHDNGKNIETLS